ncbi:MAG: PSD1 domain-containing protein, partial [Opitutaceae bacterium]|nr:PSD1 domain-containing protein [Verrucomicrobiales bacterium]
MKTSYKPNPLIPSLSPGGGEGARRVVEGKARRSVLAICYLLTTLILTLGTSSSAFAADTPYQLTASQTQFFESKIRPILVNKCYKCHSAEAIKVKGGLMLDSRDGLLKGGDSGPAIVAGNPEKSLLIKAVRYLDSDLQMPPKGEKLSDTEIADLTTWIQMGAPDPRTGKVIAKKGDGKDHWSFQPVKKPSVPDVKDKSWGATPVDAFILTSLEAKGMKPSPPADKRVLIRRAYYDLIGLPPSPEEIQTFLNDSSPNALEKVIDGLLASPRYGERWGRHWLDVARYSDTKGEVKRQRETPLYPFAWTYRDYVIKAFNDDKPYDRFILEQIAADRLPASKGNANLAAMGFLTLGDRFQNNENDIINDRIDVTTKGFLGLTVSCARCHDHMFDPIPTKDYYSLRGIFASSYEPKSKPLLGPDPSRSPEYADYYKQHMALDKQLQELAPNRKGDTRDKKELLKQRIETLNKLDALDLSHPGAPPRANVLLDSQAPKDSPVFIRGEAENKGDLVPRRFLECISGPNRKPFTSGSGRLELAQSIANKNNPLTARVMVNRIWQHHFGDGIVATPDDFGAMGAPPTHPELLDYLAARFMEDGWSIKKMHKLILLSNAWQQSSDNNSRYAQMDPFNRLLWRANLRRLEYEPLRDSLLAIGGKLDTNLFGKPVPLAVTKGRNAKASLLLEPSGRQADIGYTTRRTVYGYVDRSDLPEVFNQFDFASP